MATASGIWTSFCGLRDELKFKILLLAGREASAAFRIASGKNPDMVYVAERAMYYEPFTYWDWQHNDAAYNHAVVRDNGQSFDSTEFALVARKRKRRLLWERERPFCANDEWHAYPTPEERWEGFKRGVMQDDWNRRFVRRIAVASWMKVKDLKWIAKNLPRLKALDLSNLPRRSVIKEHVDSKDDDEDYAIRPSDLDDSDDSPWTGYLQFLARQRPKCMTTADLRDLFTYLRPSKYGRPAEREGVSERLADFQLNRRNYLYRQIGPDQISMIDGEEEVILYPPLAETRGDVTERFEEFFWRILGEQDRFEALPESPHFHRLLELEAQISEAHLLRRLEWIGVADWRFKPSAAPVCRIVPACISLETFSIRGAHERDKFAHDVPSVHAWVCELIGGIVQMVPNTVTTLELRLSVSFIEYLLERLHKRKPTIKRVGIDLGAWAQIYPLRKPLPELNDSDISSTAIDVARKGRFDAYANEHNEGLPKISKWHLPGSKDSGNVSSEYWTQHVYQNQRADPYRDISGMIDGPHFSARLTDPQYSALDLAFSKSEISQNNEDGGRCAFKIGEHRRIGRMLDDCQANTLPKMLMQLHSASRKRGKESQSAEGARLFALAPERENRSNDPIHPLTFIQEDNPLGFRSGLDFGDFRLSDLNRIYPWLEATFKWRPLFDWDWFMVPSKMAENADSDLVPVRRETDWVHIDPDHPEANKLTHAIGLLVQQFGYLRSANIPVHILIGRRHPDMSSLYWGWPFDADTWEQWKDNTFTANLEKVAPHINILSIMYDLRNPLDTDRLEEIQSQHPHKGPHARCPKRWCPWTVGKNCPFTKNVAARSSRRIGIQQKMANKLILKKPSKLKVATPEGYERLANGCAGVPLPGENANDHPSDDSEYEDSADLKSLHLRARRAAYLREALGWQRFWTAYALNLTALRVLRVRMPRCFDMTGSLRLGTLLKRSVGWNMLTYTDERQHIQTQEDLQQYMPGVSDTTYRHKSEAKIWPAGRFIRRAWVWERHSAGGTEGFVERVPVARTELGKTVATFPTKRSESCFVERAGWGTRRFEASERSETEAHERQQCSSAEEQARDATTHEDELEATIERPQNPVVPNDIEFRGIYGQHARNVAGGQWRAGVRGLAVQLDDVAPSNEHVRRFLNDTQQRLRDVSQQRPPYGAIFRRAGVGDTELTTGLPWKDHLALQVGTGGIFAKNERQMKRLPIGEFRATERARQANGVQHSANTLHAASAESASTDSLYAMPSPATRAYALASGLLSVADETSRQVPNREPSTAPRAATSHPVEASSISPSHAAVERRSAKQKRKGPFEDSSGSSDENEDVSRRAVKRARISKAPDVGTRTNAVDHAPRLVTKKSAKSSTVAAKPASKSKKQTESQPTHEATRSSRTEPAPKSTTTNLAAPNAAPKSKPAQQSSGNTGPAAPSKVKPTTKRKAHASKPDSDDDDGEPPSKRRSARNKDHTERKQYRELDIVSSDDEEEDADGQKSKKTAAKRRGSGAAYKPPGNEAHAAESETDDDDDPDASKQKKDTSENPATATKSRAVSKVKTATISTEEKTVAKPLKAKTATKSTKEKTATKSTKEKAAPTNSTAYAGDVGADYNILTVARLKEIARARGLSFKGLTRKAQYIAKLEEEDAEGSAESSE